MQALQNAIAGAIVSSADLSQKRLSFMPQVLEAVNAMRRIESNSNCADCQAPDPDWVSINTGAKICIECAGAHRSLGTHDSKVRSLTMDALPVYLVKLLEALPNSVVNEIYEALPPATLGYVLERPTKDSDMAIRKRWNVAKYAQRVFVPPHIGTPEEHKKNLIDALLANDAPKVIKFIAQGIDLNDLELGGKAILLCMIENGLPIMAEALIVSDADISVVDKDGRTAVHYAVERGDLSMVKLLVGHDANLSVPDNNGNDPLTLAKMLQEQFPDQRQKYLEIEKYLEKKLLSHPVLTSLPSSSSFSQLPTISDIPEKPDEASRSPSSKKVEKTQTTQKWKKIDWLGMGTDLEIAQFDFDYNEEDEEDKSNVLVDNEEDIEFSSDLKSVFTLSRDRASMLAPARSNHAQLVRIGTRVSGKEDDDHVLVNLVVDEGSSFASPREGDSLQNSRDNDTNEEVLYSSNPLPNQPTKIIKKDKEKEKDKENKDKKDKDKEKEKEVELLERNDEYFEILDDIDFSDEEDVTFVPEPEPVGPPKPAGVTEKTKKSEFTRALLFRERTESPTKNPNPSKLSSSSQKAQTPVTTTATVYDATTGLPLNAGISLPNIRSKRAHTTLMESPKFSSHHKEPSPPLASQSPSSTPPLATKASHQASFVPQRFTRKVPKTSVSSGSSGNIVLGRAGQEGESKVVQSVAKVQVKTLEPKESPAGIL
uniref:Arf-GAP domain-containing protein n=2 Tax=Arcella intermedia TaxID=1963864 RepID=A0A6B2KYQ5_9EUKA